jgi:hypothetical protein
VRHQSASRSRPQFAVGGPAASRSTRAGGLTATEGAPRRHRLRGIGARNRPFAAATDASGFDSGHAGSGPEDEYPFE